MAKETVPVLPSLTAPPLLKLAVTGRLVTVTVADCEPEAPSLSVTVRVAV